MINDPIDVWLRKQYLATVNKEACREYMRDQGLIDGYHFKIIEYLGFCAIRFKHEDYLALYKLWAPNIEVKN